MPTVCPESRSLMFPVDSSCSQTDSVRLTQGSRGLNRGFVRQIPEGAEDGSCSPDVCVFTPAHT